MIFTEDCTGRPRKKAGDPAITRHVTIAEMTALRDRAAGGHWTGEADFGGRPRLVTVLGADTGAVLVLSVPEEPEDEDRVAWTRVLWSVAAACIARQVAEAAPDYLSESRAATSERLRVTAELTGRHVTDLEALLAALRTRDLDDTRARARAIDLAADALIRTRSGADLVALIAEEPVSRAFERLKSDLRPLTRYEALQVQFIEPPADGRALPGEVAHAGRAIVRSAVLLMREQEEVTRIRVQWDCDGTNLLVSVRDDGPGRMDLRQLAARATALGGDLDLESVDNWGSRVEVRIPLDPPDTAEQPTGSWGLAPREAEVLRLLTAGRRNRQIATQLGISENTVKFHTSQIYQKLGVTSRAAAAALATEAGLR
ncbi:LuxR C-terminal-related transcriptional regulator [Streptomyces seoulensis]|uniref:LuxR C-terminal-related transcriptional regulator n=1 Tax=Streptomyces seoulensis TaxID=73044 RepID=UPI0036529E9D